MAQKRTVSFEQPLTSLEENHRFLGIQTPGVLCGWDGFTPSGTTLSMFHTNTGILKTNLVPTTQQGPYGIISSRQGTQIMEDATVPVVVAINAANAFDRIDILIMQHQHVESTGGTAATYSVVQGSSGGPVEPSIPNDKIQILVGKFYIKASATDHLQTDWIKEPLKIGNVKPYIMKGDGKSVESNTYEARDFNNCINAGIFTIDSTTNRPTVNTNFWHLTVGTKDLRIVQMAISMDNGKSFSRVSVDGGATWDPWHNLNNTDAAGFDPNDITDAIGAVDLASINYSSNNYVTDATSLVVAVGALDARVKINADAIGTNATNISNNLTGIGNLNYSSNNIVADSDSATTAIGKIDAAIGGRLYVNEFVITDGDILSISLDDIDTAIGSRLYSAENVVLDGEALSASIEKLDVVAFIDWVTATGTNGWQTKVEYSKVGKIGFISADRLTTTAGSGTGTFATLPISMRPTTDIEFPTILVDESGTPAYDNTLFHIKITSGGAMSLRNVNDNILNNLVTTSFIIFRFAYPIP